MNSTSQRRLHISFNAPTTLVYAFLCIMATVLGQVTGGLANTLLFSTYPSSLVDPLTYVRLFGHCIGHIGWDHLIGNLSYILLLGPMLEEKYGSRTLAEVIAIAAIVEGILQSFVFHTSVIGASGTVFAFILLCSITNLKEGEIPLTFVLIAIIYLGQEVVAGIFVRDNVSHLGHIIGGVTGAALGFALGRGD